MIATVIDDHFDKRFLYNVFPIIECLGYKATNVAKRRTWPFGEKGSHRLMGIQIFNRSNVNRITQLHSEAQVFFDIFEEIEKVLGESLYLSTIEVNLQHSGNDGTLHRDVYSGGSDYTHTIMFYPNPEWKDEWGGKFQIFSDDEKEMVEDYDYVPGRIIAFECHHPHRGLGPKKEYPYVYRYSIAFRVRSMATAFR